MFGSADVDLIRRTVTRFAQLSRTEPARTICESLPWKAPNGQLRMHACLPLLEHLAAVGQIHLPAKQAQPPQRPTQSTAQPLPSLEIRAPLSQVRPVMVEPVAAEQRALWNARIGPAGR